MDRPGDEDLPLDDVFAPYVESKRVSARTLWTWWHQRSRVVRDTSTAVIRHTLPSLDDEDAPLSLEGYLRKRGQVVKSWKRRWFVLQADRLAYFQNQLDDHKSKRQWMFAAESEHDYRLWTRTLHFAILRTKVEGYNTSTRNTIHLPRPLQRRQTAMVHDGQGTSGRSFERIGATFAGLPSALSLAVGGNASSTFAPLSSLSEDSEVESQRSQRSDESLSEALAAATTISEAEASLAPPTLGVPVDRARADTQASSVEETAESHDLSYTPFCVEATHCFETAAGSSISVLETMDLSRFVWEIPSAVLLMRVRMLNEDMSSLKHTLQRVSVEIEKLIQRMHAMFEGNDRLQRLAKTLSQVYKGEIMPSETEMGVSAELAMERMIDEQFDSAGLLSVRQEEDLGRIKRHFYQLFFRYREVKTDLERLQNTIWSHTQRIELYMAFQRNNLTDENRLIFKSSQAKKDADLEFVATNCHVQQIHVRSVVAGDSESGDDLFYATQFVGVTCGAPAAHTLGFKGGGIRQLQEEKRRLLAAAAGTVDSQTAKSVERISSQVDARTHIVLPQSLTAVVTSFCAMYEFVMGSVDEREQEWYLGMLCDVGFLANVVSLLSTIGDEAMMLGDLSGSFDEMRNVAFQFGIFDPQGVLEDSDLSNVAEIMTLYDDEDFEDEEGGNRSRSSSESDASEPEVRGAPSAVPTRTRHASSIFSSISASKKGLYTARRRFHSESSMPARRASDSGSDASVSAIDRAREMVGPTDAMVTAGRASELVAPAFRRRLSTDIVVVRYHVPLSYFSRLPSKLQAGGIIPVLPAVINQGMNETQFIASILKSEKLQFEINREGAEALGTHFVALRRWTLDKLADKCGESTASLRQRDAGDIFVAESLYVRPLHDLSSYSVLRDHFQESNESALQLSADDFAFCRQKLEELERMDRRWREDRTAMSITRELAKVLVEKCRVKQDVVEISDTLREKGTRLHNVMMNTRQQKYAFNPLQYLFLPRNYRPPSKVYGWRTGEA